MKIVVGASSFAQSNNYAMTILEEKGIEVVTNPYGRKFTKEETIQLLMDADGLLAGLEILDEEVFQNCKRLKAIARIGIGMDSVDVQSAKKYGISVSNTPDAPTEAVAEMALTCLLALSRRIVPINSNLHQKKWSKEIGFSLHGKTILFIGYGRIGQAFCDLLKPFNMNIIISDPMYPKESVLLSEGLAQADIVTIHTSGNSEILGKEQFDVMKHGIIILNSSRGKAVNEEYLYTELKNGNVKGAWVDVFSEEPYKGLLCECDNIILTPHVSTYTDRCRENMEKQAVLNLLKDLNIN